MFHLGYEIEFITNRTRRQLQDKLIDLGVKDWYGERAPDSSRSLAPNYPWHIHDDNSLNSSGGKIYAREISSGVMKYAKGLELLGRFFENMIENGDVTNSSCGFHVNLSFIDANKTLAITPLRVVLFLEEERILQQYNRTNNIYCESHRGAMRRLELDRSVERRLGAPLKTASKELLPRLIGFDKYRTVNFGKLNSSTPYLEFRAIGGIDYHKRFAEICETIDHFTKAMVYATNTNEDELYKTRLAEIRNLV